jgi:hypothetical protein
MNSRRLIEPPEETPHRCQEPSTLRPGGERERATNRPQTLIGLDVSVGSIATDVCIPRHVRFTPDSDRTADIAESPVRANMRHWDRLEMKEADLGGGLFEPP